MTDHKKEAEEYLAAGRDGLAQVHATLHLAEQQRIANLIAVFQLDANDTHDLRTIGFPHIEALGQIRDGLS